MKNLRIPSSGTEYVHVTWTSDADPTSSTVSFNTATQGAGEPSSGWQAGTWGTATLGADGRYTTTAKILTGSLSLVEGTTVALWCKVVASPETVYRLVGTLEVI